MRQSAIPKYDGRPIRFTKHALDEARIDGITEADMRAVISSCPWLPNEAGRFGQNGWSAQGVARGKTIRVIFVEDQDRKHIAIILVITTWKL